MHVIDFTKEKTEDNGPKKHNYVLELYLGEPSADKYETKSHYGFLSMSDFVSVIDSPSNPIALYPYQRVRAITVVDNEQPLFGSVN